MQVISHTARLRCQGFLVIELAEGAMRSAQRRLFEMIAKCIKFHIWKSNNSSNKDDNFELIRNNTKEEHYKLTDLIRVGLSQGSKNLGGYIMRLHIQRHLPKYFRKLVEYQI